MITGSVKQLACENGLSLRRVVWMPEIDLDYDIYTLQIRAGAQGANISLSQVEIESFEGVDADRNTTLKLRSAIESFHKS